MAYVYEVINLDYGSILLKRIDSNGVEISIPTDPANSDYQAYLKTLEAEESK